MRENGVFDQFYEVMDSFIVIWVHFPLLYAPSETLSLILASLFDILITKILHLFCNFMVLIPSSVFSEIHFHLSIERSLPFVEKAWNLIEMNKSLFDCLWATDVFKGEFSLTEKDLNR